MIKNKGKPLAKKRLFSLSITCACPLPFNFVKTSDDEAIYQTLETVFHGDNQTPRGELKIRHAVEYF